MRFILLCTRWLAAVLMLVASNVSTAQETAVSTREDQVQSSPFGSLEDSTKVELYTLKNTQGATAKVTTYGATLTELWMPDRTGKFGDVVLGFDNLQGYLAKNNPYFGATVGRVANRIANAKFTLDGKEYTLPVNDPPNSLHSGPKGIAHAVWKAEPLHESGAAAVRFSIVSPDATEGFPGNLSVSVTYRLTNSNELKLEYTATTDKPTLVNLTHHSYFNLGGTADILGEVLYLAADHYTPVDAKLIPTGEILPVKNTPLDFTHPTPIGAHLAEIQSKPVGYDHNFVLGDPGKLKLAARVSDPASGRQMEVWTTEPGVQLYTGNFLDATIHGKRGVVYGQHSAFCLETQHYPDSVHQPKFPSVILRPGETFHSETIYKFSSQ